MVAWVSTMWRVAAPMAEDVHRTGISFLVRPARLVAVAADGALSVDEGPSMTSGRILAGTWLLLVARDGIRNGSRAHLMFAARHCAGEEACGGYQDDAETTEEARQEKTESACRSVPRTRWIDSIAIAVAAGVVLTVGGGGRGSASAITLRAGS